MKDLNFWTKSSIEYANSRSYLDDLFHVYPLIAGRGRDIEPNLWKQIETAYNEHNDLELLSSVLKLKLSPIKDAYIAYLKKDKDALSRNPKTVRRLCGLFYDIGLEELYKRSSQPKETNRTMGPLFMNWLRKGALGLLPVSLEKFSSSKEDAILDASDSVKKEFAANFLGYKRDKGLDLVARFNGKYIIGEAKFLSDYGGHQIAQLNDALDTLNAKCNAIRIAILDGVIYIPGKNKMHLTLYQNKEQLIMSSLLLRDFLFQV